MIRRVAGWPLGLVGAAALVATLSASPARAPTGVALPADVGALTAFTVALRPSSVTAWPSSVAAPLPSLPSRGAVAPVADTVFRHEDHGRVECTTCHGTDPVHGELRVRTLADCRACHHQAPLANDCAACHTAADAPVETLALPRALALSVGSTAPRPLPFSHARHQDVSCATCHTEGLARSAATLDCASCHLDHHGLESDCASCHVSRLEMPPHPIEVHIGCAGAGCHTELPFEGVPRTRALCLSCHQELAGHKPGQVCTTCHLLPRPRAVPGANPPAQPAADPSTPPGADPPVAPGEDLSRRPQRAGGGR